ncbi:hypothetical protein GXW71_06415 [Roseomonas hellenica]|uniref:ANTAR domain-containing protein n=1 Tax=Plastoroseomonas hellenica TaxID=2687306 RepID=A0ABS5EUL0_9PROT|nr:hypothetical protein [Plastoroseomonas hellenica]MBR0663988.1 hypothetical protein [Plastoroseomonas hellenica]
MSAPPDAALHDMLALLAQSQAMLIANLSLALSQAAGIPPETLASLMEHTDMQHRDERVSVLADGMRRAVLETLRATRPGSGGAQPQ